MSSRLLAHVMLGISDPERSIAFYTGRLGMSLLASVDGSAAEVSRYYLGFADGPDVDTHGRARFWHPAVPLLELHHASTPIEPEQARSPGSTARPQGYWKIGLTVRDIEEAYARLRNGGVAVGDPPDQFRDIARLCHFADPDGHAIELIERSEDGAKPKESSPSALPLGSYPVWSQVTIRVKDPAQSLRFYRDLMGMALLAQMDVPDLRFSLYFLAYTEETPPDPDLTALGNRDWLWNRPYVTLELQHRWGTETDPDFAYETGGSGGIGFGHMGIICDDLSAFMTTLRDADVPVLAPAADDHELGARAATVADPDGYRVRLLES